MIKTPLCRLFIAYYGCQSVQLISVKLKNWKSLLNLVLNITFFCTSLYKVTSESMAYTADEAALPNISRALAEKPLYSLFYSGTLVLGLTSFSLRFVYFALLSLVNTENCDLVSNLDALTQVNPGGYHAVSEKRSKQLIFVVITFNHLLYIFCLSEGIFWRLLSYNFGDLAFTYVSFYWMTINMNIAFILLHYTQLATLHSLNGISKSPKSNSKLSIAKISQLAKINQRIHRLLSLPLLLSVVPYIFDITFTLSSLWIKKFSGANPYFLQFLLHACLLAHFDRRIRLKIRQILENLQNTENKALVNVQIFEQLYSGLFSPQLFNLCSLNWPFIGSICLFTLNYFVLLTQTQ